MKFVFQWVKGSGAIPMPGRFVWRSLALEDLQNNFGFKHGIIGFDLVIVIPMTERNNRSIQLRLISYLSVLGRSLQAACGGLTSF
jgi:hypothetical protein